MITKRGKKPTKKVKTLRAKSLTSAQAKGVKGGFVYGNETKITTKALADGSVRTNMGISEQKV